VSQITSDGSAISPEAHFRRIPAERRVRRSSTRAGATDRPHARPKIDREKSAGSEERRETPGLPSRSSVARKGRLAMADKRALKWIGMLFGAVTLTVISTTVAIIIAARQAQ
jgi:hypothetical protein